MLVLDAALQLQPAERAEHITVACAGDERLRQRVNELLAAAGSEDADQGFLTERAPAWLGELVRTVDATDTEALAQARTEVGQALASHYDIGAELGRGGHAVVYRARDLRHNRDVAVKVIADDLITPSMRVRFQREIRIASRLQHPFIVSLIDSGSAGESLYYVMPLVEGESLRDRIDREGQLPLEDALGIARDVADALDYSHAQGVVHRDIKPSNILLRGGHALLADFGIATVREGADDGRVTATGMVIGTPHYMSPEQAIGGTHVDGRSDVYSLGCVVYEMLAGEVPFPGATPGAVRAKHLHAPVPDVRILRSTVGDGMQEVLVRGLAKTAADRYASAGQFIAALSQAVGTGTRGPPGGPRTVRRAAWRTAAWVALTAGVTAAAFVAWQQRAPLVTDPERLALFPVARSGDATPALADAARWRDAFRHWTDLRLVDEPRMAEALGVDSTAPLSLSRSRDVAMRAGAGQFVRGAVSAADGEVHVTLTLYESVTGRFVAEASRRVASPVRDVDGLSAELVRELLFGRSVPTLVERNAPPGTQVAASYRSYLAGHAALADWNLAGADSAFVRARETDPEYGAAALWLSLLRIWGRKNEAEWRSAAQQATRDLTRFGPRDSTLAAMLSFFLRDDTPGACRLAESLVTRMPDDFVAWYASADCLGGDLVAVRDGRSPSGWRLRGSMHTALERYRHAFQLMPSVHVGLSRNGFEPARALFQTTQSILLSGRAQRPDTEMFLISPTLRADTLVFVPIPWDKYMEPSSPIMRRIAPAIPAAIRRQRAMFRDLAAGWVASAPRSADAYTALGISLQLLGDRSAIDTLARARRLATTTEARARATIASIIVGVQIGAGEDPALLEQAAHLADSLLRDSAAVGLDPSAASTIAGLLGRASLAAQWRARIVRSPINALPPRLVNSVERLTTFAALGGPPDSLDTIGELLFSRLDSTSEGRTLARHLLRPLGLALPNHHLRALAGLDPDHDLLLSAARALALRDTAQVRSRLTELEAGRASVPPEDRKFETLLPEAWLFLQLRDTASAERRLDPSLAVTALASVNFADHVHAGMLVRTMALRADLAAARGQPAVARRWARAVVALWSGADPFLQPTVARMRRLVS